jgi:hypothetical protein
LELDELFRIIMREAAGLKGGQMHAPALLEENIIRCRVSLGHRVRPEFFQPIGHSGCYEDGG